jgi:hypothetical protein
MTIAETRNKIRISGYNIYLQEHSVKMSQDEPQKRPYEIMQQVALSWGCATEQEKELYRMTADCLVSVESS